MYFLTSILLCFKQTTLVQLYITVYRRKRNGVHCRQGRGMGPTAQGWVAGACLPVVRLPPWYAPPWYAPPLGDEGRGG